jgi:hypothetical protein
LRFATLISPSPADKNGVLLFHREPSRIAIPPVFQVAIDVKITVAIASIRMFVQRNISILWHSVAILPHHMDAYFAPIALHNRKH